ncbi:MAG TPA: dienelactone hydrolase family protein [Polyangiaceae bacterium]|nr:dienelactone hydrolase family protein [Polyangiaceae bacterium]
MACATALFGCRSAPSARSTATGTVGAETTAGTARPTSEMPPSVQTAPLGTTSARPEDAPSPNAAPEPAHPASSPYAAVEPSHPALSLEYLEAMTGGAAPEAPEPLVIALHGLGASPDNFITLFQEFPAKARILAPHSRTPFSEGFQWFPPSDPMSDASAPDMKKAADEVFVFAKEAAKRLPTLGKPLFVGFSQGGALSYAIAVRHSAAIGASFPISGWLPGPLVPATAPPHTSPIFSFHGDADRRVPLERDQSAVDQLKKLGFSIEFHVADGVPHGISPEERRLIYAALSAQVEAQRNKPAHR